MICRKTEGSYESKTAKVHYSLAATYCINGLLEFLFIIALDWPPTQSFNYPPILYILARLPPPPHKPIIIKKYKHIYSHPENTLGNN